MPCSGVRHNDVTRDISLGTPPNTGESWGMPPSVRESGVSRRSVKGCICPEGYPVACLSVGRESSAGVSRGVIGSKGEERQRPGVLRRGAHSEMDAT